MFISHEGERYLQVPMFAENYAKTSVIGAWSRIILPVGFLITFLVGLVVIPMMALVNLVKRKGNRAGPSLAVWLTIVSFFIMMYCLITGLGRDAIHLMGKPSMWAQGYFIFNIVYLILGIVSLYLVYRNWRNRSKLGKTTYVLFGWFFLLSVLYLGVFDMVGLRTWKY